MATVSLSLSGDTLGREIRQIGAAVPPVTSRTTLTKIDIRGKVSDRTLKRVSLETVAFGAARVIV